MTNLLLKGLNTKMKIQIVLTNDGRLVAGTAQFVANIAGNCGLQKERADALCPVIKTILELRMRDLNDNYPFIDLEI